MRRVARALSVGGGVVVVAVLSKLHAAVIAVPGYDFTGSSRFAWAAVYAAMLSIAAYALGLPEWPRTLRQAWVAGFGSALVAAGGISAAQLLVGDALLPRFVVFGTVLAMIPVHVGANAIARHDRSRSEERVRVLLVGSATERARLDDDLRTHPERPASLVGHLTAVDAGAHPIGTTGADPLAAAAATADATLVVLDRDAQGDEQVIARAAALHESGIRIRTLGGFYEEWLGKLPLSELERTSLFFDIGEVHRSTYGRLKRLCDLGIAVLGCGALALVTPAVVIGNAFGNRGPLLYRQVRVGKGGEHFTILKFRTMRESADGAATTWTGTDDPRVTSFGGFLRRSHLDELPQVLNIVRGDLSVVGPRPEQPRYVTELSDKLAFYDLRHLVRPGLTGWAQVKYGYAGDERDALEKLQYEFFYLRHQDLRFDARIMVRTVRSIATGAGR